jgi:hypothetical protein
MSDKITNRQWRQDYRIDNGVRSGALDAEEARQLRNGQRDIDQAIRAARADGHVDAGERQAIRGLQDAASRDIYELKHNDTRNHDLVQPHPMDHRVLQGPTDHQNPGPFITEPLDLQRRPDLVVQFPTDNQNPGPFITEPLDLQRTSSADADRLAQKLWDLAHSMRHEHIRG